MHNYSNNFKTKTVILFVVTFFLLIQKCQLSFTDMIITSSNLECQELATYTFQIFLYDLPLIPANSIIYLYFPTDYPSSSLKSYSCLALNGFDPGASLSCSIQYRTLKITGGFPISVNSSYIELDINLINIQNPMYSVNTQLFSGNLTDSSGNQITVLNAFSGGTLQITTGTLEVSTSISPTTVHTNSTLTVTINSSHIIPKDGYLNIRFNAYWDTNAVNTTQIINSQTKCFSYHNTASNLFCNFTPNIAVINLGVYNVFDNDFQGVFSFTIFPFANPSTTAPQGSFEFMSYDSLVGNHQIDDSTYNFLSGFTTAAITSSSITLLNYTIGLTTTATIQCFISNIIISTDLISIQFPAQINLSKLTQVIVQNFVATNLQVSSSNLVTFQNLNINNPSTVIFQFNNITLPSYVTTLTSFSIQTNRSSFSMDYVQNSLSITTKNGDMNAIISLNQYESGNKANYTFQLTFDHNVDENFTILFEFPVQYFDFITMSNLSCLSSVKSGCLLSIPSANQILVSSVIQSSTSINSVNITIKNVINPSFVGSIDMIKISSFKTLNSKSYLVDSTSSNLTITYQARQLLNSNISITSTSSITYANCDLIIAIKNNNFVPQNSIISIKVPYQITLPNLISCSISCIFSSGSVQITIDQDYQSGLLPSITIYGIRNPTSTRPTSLFQFIITDSSNTILQFLTSSSSIYYQSITPSGMTVTVNRNSTTNSQTNTLFTFKLGINFDISSGFIVIQLSNDISCDSCIKQAFNSSFYQISYQNQSTINKNLILSQIFTNPYSLKPYVINVYFLTADSIYSFAVGSVSVQNQLPSLLFFNHSFTNTQLKSITNAAFSNFSDSNMDFSSNSDTVQVSFVFGDDFNISLATSTDYSLSVQSNIITFNSTFSFLSLSSFTIKSLVTPIISPSLPIYVILSIYSNNILYLVSKSAYFYWSLICQLPCKTCTVSNNSACLSCYNDSSLVSEQILYNPNNTCTSLCGDKYYQNSTDNTCRACSTSCYNCINNSTLCTSCNNGYYLLASNYTCFQNVCPIGYFIYYSSCKDCTITLNCSSCSDSLTCDSCANGFYYYQTKCLINCPSLITIQNSYTNNCDSCPTNCSQCTQNGSLIICTKCQNGYFLDNSRCYTSCRSVNLVPNGNQCTICHYTCLTCINSIYNCLTCNQSSVNKYIFQQRCLTSCPNGYYQSMTSPFTCLTCVQPCQYCESSSVNSCQSCIVNFTLYNTTCQSICPQGYYQNASNCVLCDHPCKTCLTSVLCMQCVNNYSLFVNQCLQNCYDGYVSINNVCQNCSSNCKTCSSINYCTSCYNGTYLFEGSCVYPCPIGFYENVIILKFVCSECDYTCAQCINETTCTVCNTGYSLSTALKCINTCPTSYIPISGICTICSQNCTSCRNTVETCTQCKPTFYYIPSLNKCELECVVPLRYYQTNMSCLTSCLAHSYQYSVDNTSGIYCMNCPQYCFNCLSDIYCTACYNGTFFYNNLCYNVCPALVPFSINGYCKSCNVVSCYQCSGTSCVQCNPNYLLIGSSLCISNCSNNQVYDSVNKICQTIVTPINNGTTTTSTISSITRLNFIPLPYLIITFFFFILTLILHYTHKIFIIQTMIGISSVALTLCAITTLLVYFLGGFSSQLDKIGLFALLAGIGGTYFLNFIGFYLYLKQHNKYESKWKELPTLFVQIASLIFNFKFLSIFNAYFYKHISIKSKQNKKFWYHIFNLQKVSLLVNLLLILSGLQFLFSLMPVQTSYFYYSCVQLVVLAVINIFLTVLTSFIKINTNVVQDQNNYDVQDSLDNIGRSLDQQKDKENQTPFNYDQITSTYTIHPHSQQIQNQKQNLTVRNMSEQLSPIKKIVVPNSQIQKALEDGLFREGQKDINKKKEQSQQLTLLQSASKMIRLNRQKEQAKQKQLQMGLNIFEIQNENGEQNLQNKDKENNKQIQNEFIQKQNQSRGNNQKNNQNLLQKQLQQKNNSQNYQHSNRKKYSLYQKQLKQKSQSAETFLNPNIIFEDFCQENQTEFPQTQNKSQSSEQIQHLPKQKYTIQHSNPSKQQKQGIKQYVVKVQPNQEFYIEEIQDQILSQTQNQQQHIKNVFDDYPQFKQQKLRETKNSLNKRKNRTPQILHADLQSIATVSESSNFVYSDQEDVQQKNIFDFQKEQSMIVQQYDQDNKKPSEMLKTQVNLLSKLKHDLPQGLQRAKKVKKGNKQKKKINK